MKYNLNKLPIKTTNNFKVNDLEIDLDLPRISSFKDFNIIGDTESIDLKISTKSKKIKSRIGLEFNNYLDVNINVLKNVSINEPIIFKYDFNKKDSLIDKISINFEENSSCDFIFIYNSLDKEENFHHLFLDVNACSNSNGSITLVNLLNDNSYNFMAMENKIYNSSNICCNVIDLGGSVRIYNSYSDLLECYSKNYLNHIYIGKNSEIIDINYYAKNIGKDSISKIVCEGSLDDNCRKTFRGTIDFIKGCSNSIGEENENCVLLSNNCRSRSLPQMLCGEENVIGTHGVSSGRVDEDKLFYIMSRGFSLKEAERLIVLANFRKVINKIPSSKIQDLILDKIEEKI